MRSFVVRARAVDTEVEEFLLFGFEICEWRELDVSSSCPDLLSRLATQKTSRAATYADSCTNICVDIQRSGSRFALRSAVSIGSSRRASCLVDHLLPNLGYLGCVHARSVWISGSSRSVKVELTGDKRKLCARQPFTLLCFESSSSSQHERDEQYPK